MCSNRGLVDRIECCMEDIVECFEDYITKSLIALSVALGIIVASVVYLLKIVSERTLEISPSSASANSQYRRNDIRNTRSYRQAQGRRQLLVDGKQSKPRRDNVKENYLMIGKQDEQVSTTPGLKNVRSIPSFDESVLREVGLSCCAKPCCLSKKKSKESNQVKQQLQQRQQDTRRPRQRSITPIKNRSRSNSPKRSLQSLPICSKSSSKGSCCSMYLKKDD
ncbi:unnamed protein product [Colias eurytheme]|nr:unnamed protein product [Colias eurytheme]